MQASQPDASFFRRTVLLLAAYGEVDKRTAERAAREGVEVIHGFVTRQRIRRAAEQLGVTLPLAVADRGPTPPAKLSVVRGGGS